MKWRRHTHGPLQARPSLYNSTLTLPLSAPTTPHTHYTHHRRVCIIMPPHTPNGYNSSNSSSKLLPPSSSHHPAGGGGGGGGNGGGASESASYHGKVGKNKREKKLYPSMCPRKKSFIPACVRVFSKSNQSPSPPSLPPSLPRRPSKPREPHRPKRKGRRRRRRIRKGWRRKSSSRTEEAAIRGLGFV